MLIFLSALCFILTANSQNVLSTVSFQDTNTIGNPIPSNFAGISLNFPSIMNDALTSPLFQQLIKNSWVFGSTSASWGISIKMPVGYKWDCPNSWTGFIPTPNCTTDVKPYYSSIGNFFQATANNNAGVSLGFDREGVNFGDFSFYMLFMNWFFDVMMLIGNIGYGLPSLEMFDKADLYQVQNITPQPYDPAAFQTQAWDIYYMTSATIMGPGLSTSANSTWKDTFNSLPYGYLFTVYAAPFVNQSELTISNVLNEVYYQNFLNNLFMGTNGLLNMAYQKTVITELAMIEGTGVDGVTNTMVSAIWALDTLLEGAKFGLERILLKADPSNTDFISVFGAAPNYDPQPIYYALLLMSIIQEKSYTYFLSPSIMQGSSQLIKVYGLKSGTAVSLVLLNKDTNTSASGEVILNSTSIGQMSCIYLSASSLNSKNVTLAGMSLTSGNSVLQGTYTEKVFNNTDGNGFRISLNYAQVAYCRFLAPDMAIPKVAFSWEQKLTLLLTLTFLTLFF